jgi:hypothetical protein
MSQRHGNGTGGGMGERKVVGGLGGNWAVDSQHGLMRREACHCA